MRLHGKRRKVKWGRECGGGGGARDADIQQGAAVHWGSSGSSLPSSLPALHLSLPPSFPLFLFLSCSPLCRLTGMKSWLLIKTPHPPSLPAIFPTCSLHRFPLSCSPFSHYFSPFLLFFPPPLPLFCFAATLLFQLSPPPPVSHSVHLSSPASSLFRFQSSSLHLSSSHSPSFFVIFSTPLFTSTPTSKQQK